MTFEKELLLGTGNAFKARELAAMMGGLPLLVRTLRDFPELEEVEENGKTLEENAGKKALAYSMESGLWVLADDTGLEVDALGGAPGVYSARYAGAGHDSEANNRKLLRELEGLPPEKRTAAFRCALALASPEGRLTVETGGVNGRIAGEYRGGEGFGYDPIFILAGGERTMGELPFEDKIRLSHRADAMARMRPHLEKLAIESSGERARTCPRCGLELDAWHCRMLCPGCGYQEDCSDVALP
jgi:XTP/dITP diphosphohydrolase